ncbi:uncharacterized protein RCC_03109 [Ramularia collo-cygni]|uniref:Uncharacterized protein n=1 Tax=Ramularia collo-cygni TaxID=112498 RepID=A0A2D3UTL6_9PEZI|nr:uncharacterized protein RCC_03109 [Ramularia collo-cygni]CZT17275.1 uncharacterized protein RCC_03109 [Ramularia collo-cygni]
MRGRGFNAIGLIGATVCGVATAYTALQPALEEQQLAKEGTFGVQHNTVKDSETAISQAIQSDLKEAKEELTNAQKGGFAWGIRQMLFGGPSPRDRNSQPDKEDGQPRTG